MEKGLDRPVRCDLLKTIKEFISEEQDEIRSDAMARHKKSVFGRFEAQSFNLIIYRGTSIIVILIFIGPRSIAENCRTSHNYLNTMHKCINRIRCIKHSLIKYV